MTRQETGIIMDILTTAYPRFYAGPEAPDMRKTISLWAEMFQYDSAALVAAAVKSVIEGDEKGFPPTIGQVKAKMRLITAPEELSEAEAWGLVSKAIRNSLYGAQEEFEALPPAVRRVVGSPNMLREWARMDTESVNSVVASNFQRSYRAIHARERELEKLPADVKAIISELNAAKKPEALAPRTEPRRLPEAEEAACAPMPEHVRQTLNGTGLIPPRRNVEDVLRYLRGEQEAAI